MGNSRRSTPSTSSALVEALRSSGIDDTLIYNAVDDIRDMAGTNIDAEFEVLNAKLDARFETLDARFEALDAKFESRFETLSSRIDGLSESHGGRILGLYWMTGGLYVLIPTIIGLLTLLKKI